MRFAGSPPSFIYGTAWKEDETERLVTQALAVGFRAIDTANQRKHYFEAGVGAALRAAFVAGRVKREELFVQTKFTHRDGQDDRLPYDERAPVATQVRQSALSSLEHLPIGTIDSYVLHGPSQSRGLAPEDLEAWRAMEDLLAEGIVSSIGASNVTKEQLALLCEQHTPPSMVQNRCYARRGWDREVRVFCKERGIGYQGFSLLTANTAETRSPAFQKIVKRTGATTAQVVFCFARAVGMICLTGSSSKEHLAEDLAATDVSLSPEEIQAIERISG